MTIITHHNKKIVVILLFIFLDHRLISLLRTKSGYCDQIKKLDFTEVFRFNWLSDSVGFKV